MTIPAFDEKNAASKTGSDYVPITLGGKEMKLQCCCEAILEIEQGTGMGVMALAKQASFKRHGLSEKSKKVP